MKKKHRDIVVDGVKYGWIVYIDLVHVYKDRKEWFSFVRKTDVFPITPKIVAEEIKKKLQE